MSFQARSFLPVDASLLFTLYRFQGNLLGAILIESLTFCVFDHETLDALTSSLNLFLSQQIFLLFKGSCVIYVPVFSFLYILIVLFHSRVTVVGSDMKVEE